jgi:DNA-binding LytR/AlgR family response regulator
MISLELEAILEDTGVEVIGPVGTLEAALEMIQRVPEIDSAVLDIHLRGKQVFPAASLLDEMSVPYLFHTGHGDVDPLKQQFSHVPVCHKPVIASELLDQLARLVNA